ncbi:CRISPR-associated protein Cas4 [Stakelama tenebrarum]|uniref:CRISPR-associated protein Cas4 n=1 Tax=Stakelama tenebrarum TaxID=2711215 RepID=UPI001D1899FA|nr:CRISPR-associated protein Cas4 [Sphingosinithalassobacter tenebrarum]
MSAATDDRYDDVLIPVSALQHYLFCPRQCALIHVERQWAEDGATAEGRILHDRVDKGGGDRRRDVRLVRSLPIRAPELGLIGVADVVEFHGRGAAARPFPVEYKRGKPKAHRADEVQLCAQGLCLEAMFGHAVPEGALFYGEVRRRRAVSFDDDLRALTLRIVQETRAMFAARRTPPPVPFKGCTRCSLADLCRPATFQQPPSVRRWLERQIGA